MFSELALNFRFFLLTIKKKESEQETNHGSSIESPRFLLLFFEELQKRSLLRRNCTGVGLSGLCSPLMYWEGFFEEFLNFRDIKVFGAEGGFEE
ncbi:conserved domain protein [Parasutterella excrementihominis YIT 11859]|uniref:Conserved domain protein n=1 Tax=Parasutterella excrementihominis YIT 11859 TaxID=762966 RepID=F3QM85_9BURK|nr:conserved domain protein [Parasutterella excrementihominis YIT 11859]